MFHLDPFDQDVIFLVIVIVVEESSIEHDWIVFLRNLVRLWKITVRIVFPIEFDLRENTTSKSK